MRRLAAALGAALALAGCFDVEAPDLFQITRTGPGAKLSFVVNNSGTISCNRGRAKPISSKLLIGARDLSDNLSGDASAGLTIPLGPGDVYYYRIRMPQGTISFPDRAAATHPALAAAEQFTLSAAADCGA